MGMWEDGGWAQRRGCQRTRPTTELTKQSALSCSEQDNSTSMIATLTNPQPHLTPSFLRFLLYFTLTHLGVLRLHLPAVDLLLTLQNRAPPLHLIDLWKMEKNIENVKNGVANIKHEKCDELHELWWWSQKVTTLKLLPWSDNVNKNQIKFFNTHTLSRWMVICVPLSRSQVDSSGWTFEKKGRNIGENGSCWSENGRNYCAMKHSNVCGSTNVELSYLQHTQMQTFSPVALSHTITQTHHGIGILTFLKSLPEMIGSCPRRPTLMFCVCMWSGKTRIQKMLGW